MNGCIRSNILIAEHYSRLARLSKMSALKMLYNIMQVFGYTVCLDLSVQKLKTIELNKI